MDGRKNAGIGEIETSRSRFLGKLSYENEINSKLKINLTGFYAFDEMRYDKYLSTTPYYLYAGTSDANSNVLRRFIGTSDNPNEIDQSDSSFKESKFGAQISLDWAHTNGVFVAGIESIYEKAKRNPIQHLKSAIFDNTGNTNGSGGTGTPEQLRVKINTPLDISKWTNAIFMLDKYDFSPSFSVQGGVRYELSQSKLDAGGSIDAVRDTQYVGGKFTNPQALTNPIQATFDKAHSNVAVEITPAFRYSNTGVIYGHYQRGFNATPSYALLERDGTIDFSKATGTEAAPTVLNTIIMTETNLEDEIYNHVELGFKDYLPTREIRIGQNAFTIDAILFSANVFYTTSKNEFYFEGDPYNGLKYKNYENSRRYGVELALEQYLLGGRLGFNESFTYLKAEAKKKAEDLAANEEAKYEQIPQTYNYKATLGISVALTRAFVNTDLWMQNSFYGKQKVISAIYNAAYAKQEQDEYLDPYLISDIGLSFGFNKGAIVLSAGVKNVFDTLYYDYYNNDKTASIGEYRYLLGQGRTWFVEGVYKY